MTAADERVLLLSPHLDDAVFSAYTLMTDHRPDVWTVFAGIPDDPGPTAWDTAAGYTDSQAFMRDRRAEDADALDDLGVRVRHLDGLDRAYADPARRAADLAALVADIDAWLTDAPGVLCVPVGAGTRMKPGLADRLRGKRPAAGAASSPADSSSGPTTPPAPQRAGLVARLKGIASWLLHQDYLRRRCAAQRRGMLANEDHLAVRDAVVDAFAANPRARLWFYEELPYLWGQPGDDAAAELAARLGLLTVDVLPVDRDAKAARTRRYVTQVTLMDPVEDRLGRPEALPATERVWRLEA